MTHFACKLLSEQGFGFRKANVLECRVFASHFPSDEVQNEAKFFDKKYVRPVSKNRDCLEVVLFFFPRRGKRENYPRATTEPLRSSPLLRNYLV